MTIETQTPRVVYIGNGTSGPFSLQDGSGNPIRLRTATDLVVWRYSSTTDEVGDQLVYSTDFTVINTDPDAATFTLTSVQPVLTSSQRLVVTREQSVSQDLSLTLGGNFGAVSDMAQRDIVAEQIQELRRDVDRAIKPSWRSTVAPTLPIAPSATKLLGHTSDDTLAHVEVATISPTGVTLGSGWSTVLGLAATSSLDIAVDARLYGFKVGGGNADATANTTALQAALDANYWVMLPEGTAYINKITHTRVNRLSGAGQSATILYRANSLNDYVLFASAKNDMIYEDFTINMNRANNTGSGPHGGIRLESACSRWQLRRVNVTGARGLFSGSPVGAGFSSVGGGSNGQFDNCWFDDCYDGYVLSAHTDARDFGTWFTACTRNGGLVSSASDRFESHGVYAFGNSTTYGGAGLQIIDSPDSKTYGGTFSSNTLGHGLQHNGSDRCEVHGGTFNSNGISGLDFFDSIDGKVFGGYAASNTVRGIEIDSASNGCMVVSFQGVSNTDVDISVFRSADCQLTNCEGNVRAWDSGNISSATVSAGGTGYTVGDVLTVVGGTGASPAATLTIATLSGSAVATVTVSNAGLYSTFPSEPFSVTGGTGSGATFNFVGVAEASSAVARLQIDGGHRSDTILLVTDASVDVRLSHVKATTITDQSSEIVSAVGCSNFVMPKIALTLQNSWVAYNASWQEPVYWKSSERKVRVQGSIKDGTTTAATVIATLPVGYRPAKVEGPFVGFASGGTTVAVYVSTNGQITAQTALNATLTVIDIEFDVAA